MRKIILFIIAVMLSVTFSYAESCSCGQGCLSYQISGCSEQKRACCSGTWCSWGTSSCASCTATTQACSGNVTNACAGNRTRSVTGSCGSSCTYGSWSNSGCSYTQSCTATSESRNCSGNVSNACAGTQTRTRTVKSTCGSCSYNSWGSWSTSGCSYTQSCTATSESRNCSGNVSGACAGTQSRSRSVTGSCGSCSYASWGGWTTSGCRYTKSCTETSKTESCTVNGKSYAKCYELYPTGNFAGGGNYKHQCSRSVSSNCGSCSYSSWSCGSCALEKPCYNPLTSGGCQYHELWVLSLSTRYSTLSACRSAWTYYDDLYDDAGVYGGMGELDWLLAGGGDAEGMTCNSFNSNHYYYVIKDCIHIFTDSQGSIIAKDTNNHYYNIYDYNTADSISEGYYLLGVVTGCVCNTGLSYGDKYYIPPNVLRAPFNNGVHSGLVTH